MWAFTRGTSSSSEGCARASAPTTLYSSHSHTAFFWEKTLPLTNNMVYYMPLHKIHLVFGYIFNLPTTIWKAVDWLHGYFENQFSKTKRCTKCRVCTEKNLSACWISFAIIWPLQYSVAFHFLMPLMFKNSCYWTLREWSVCPLVFHRHLFGPDSYSEPFCGVRRLLCEPEQAF